MTCFILHTYKAEGATHCLSLVTFGTTAGILLAIIVALSIVGVKLCMQLRKNNGMTSVTSKYLSKSSCCS